MSLLTMPTSTSTLLGLAPWAAHIYDLSNLALRTQIIKTLVVVAGQHFHLNFPDTLPCKLSQFHQPISAMHKGDHRKVNGAKDSVLF
jgi:hypothetical protein